MNNKFVVKRLDYDQEEEFYKAMNLLEDNLGDKYKDVYHLVEKTKDIIPKTFVVSKFLAHNFCFPVACLVYDVSFSYPNSKEGEKFIAIKYLAVDPKYRRKGFGKQLVNTLEDFVKSVKFNKIKLETDIENSPFYENLGFKPFDKSGDSIYLEKKLD